MDDLEDGELVEDSPAVKETPAVTNNAWRAVTVDVPGARVNLRNVDKRTRLRNPSSSDSDTDQDERSSDDDYEPVEKKQLGSGGSVFSSFGNPNGGPTSNASKSKQKYNIWGSVIQEQSLAQNLSGWFGMNKKVDSDRDVETYDYTNALKDERCIGPNEATSLHPEEAEEDKAQFVVSDICDKETFGTDVCPSTVECDKTAGKRSDSTECSDDDSMGERTKDCSNRPPAKDRLGSRVDKEIGSSDTTDVGHEIHRRLCEPEHMKDTFVRIAKVLGVVKARDLLSQTEAVEEAGGLKILNGNRRRTPGGVYLYLLKGDKSVSKAQYKEIFKDHFEKQKQCQKEAKKRRWKERAAAVKESMKIDQQLPLCEKKEPPLAQSNKSRPVVAVDYDDFGLDDSCAFEIDLEIP